MSRRSRGNTTSAADRTISSRLAHTSLSPALRRVAEVLLTDPQSVVFGTVASVATAAGTSTPSVIRLAAALGYSGFAELRDAARSELAVRLNTDAVRARAAPAGDPIGRLRSTEESNVASTLDGLDAGTLEAVVDLLDDDERRVWVLSSTQTAGVALRFADQLTIVRDRTTLLDGSELRMMSMTPQVQMGDVIVSMDIARHELTTVRVQAAAVEHGAIPVVLTGTQPIGLSAVGGYVLPFACKSVGPFESLVGLTALTTLLVNLTVARRHATVSSRVTELEHLWTTTGLFDN